MNAFLLMVIGMSFAYKELLATTGCHESCLVCFKNSVEFCYVCKDGLFFDISGICTEQGVKDQESDECPSYSFMDPTAKSCKSCPFECNACVFNQERGGVDCTECYEEMGVAENGNKPYEAFGVKGCHCFGFLDQGYCTVCNTDTQDYDEESLSCVDKLVN